MIVGEADCSSVKMNEMYRFQPTLPDLRSIFTLDLLPPLGIAEWIGYALPLWYVSCLLLRPDISRTFVALALTGLITNAAFPLMLCQHTYS
jgi:hypothetical protein